MKKDILKFLNEYTKNWIERLSKSKYLSGNNYTIADIGTFPWIARHEWHDIGLKNYKNLTRWYDEISKRDGVKKGFAFMDENEFHLNHISSLS